ncbi:MAG TPA: hypothetical protein VFB52_14640 [Solirubrobacterales bacterium]|nr:hypothetical protein [Solirubrobacterales bacterium]
MSKRTLMIGIATGLVALVPLSATATANDADVKRAGTCSGNTSAKIKLSPDDGRIETEFEVDQNRNGVTWRVVLRRNGAVAVRTQGTTRGPSGSFEVERRLTDGQGTDTVTARAVSPSGEVCTAQASI